MADVSSCNGCHEKLALHGGGRVDMQYCVMCHNPGTTDANSGNVLTMQTMTHKIHSGRLLASIDPATLATTRTSSGATRASKHDYSEVGFPQDLRNCTVCHTAANPRRRRATTGRRSTSKEACLTCHASATGTAFDSHTRDFALVIVGPGGTPLDIPNSELR